MTSIEERDADRLRSSVASEYARKAVGAGCGDRRVAGTAGYTSGDLEGVPRDVVEPCGPKVDALIRSSSQVRST